MNTLACSVTEQTAREIRISMTHRLNELMEYWMRAQFGEQFDNEYGTGYWAERIRNHNDARIASGLYHCD